MPGGFVIGGEAGWGVAAGWAAAALVLLALAGSRWLRVEPGTRPGLGTTFRILAGALLAGAGVVAIATGVAAVPASLALPEAWATLARPEWIAVAAFVVLVVVLDPEPGRLGLMLGAGLAGGAAFAAATWLGAVRGPLPLAPATLALVAGVASVALLSPGRTAQLVARLRRTASGADEIHVVLVDAQGRVRHASAPTRAALGLKDAGTRAWRARPSLPRALRGVLDKPAGERARFRATTGHILEARVMDVAGRKRRRAVVLEDVTSEHQRSRRLAQLAHHDSLTGLANRRLFLERLRQVVEPAGAAEVGRAALFYLDLDDFKAINDSLGHAAGDALLCQLADRLREHLGAPALARFGIDAASVPMVARLAGDEFAVIAPRLPSADTAGELAQLVLDVIRKPLELTDRTVSPSASIGIALFPSHGRDVETLLRRADSALYLAKSRGKHRYAYYEASLEERAQRARQIEEGLRSALADEEMSLHYQPKVDARSSELVGFEALLRWKSATLGEVGPGEFIPVAEDRGLVTELGTWCIGEACRQMRAWQDGGLAVVPVSVNVSSVQFVESDLQRVVSDALKRHGVDPRHLELELTESLLLDESNNVEEILADLRAIGVRIALDDFGTGYSALTYLNRFRLDVLKMDRGLVRDIDTDPSALGIVKAVVSMAHSLGLSVVAEGVDSGLQVPILQDVECDQIQGFLYAPAVPADEAVRFMSPHGEPRVRLSEQGTSPGNRAVETPAEPAIDERDDTPALRAPEGGAVLPDRAPHSPAPATAAASSTSAIGQVALTKRTLPVEDDGSGAYASVARTAAPGDATAGVSAETPVLARTAATAPARRRAAIGHVLLVDDDGQSLSTVVMRLLHLGLDVHYASAVDEAALYIGQEGAAIRVVAFAPKIAVAQCQRVHAQLVEAAGEPRSWIVIGERPDEPARRALREAGVDWVLWAPFNDAELRYLVKSAMTRHDELVDRREVRVPVELVASIWSGSRREMAVVSSLSARGAFIELSEPLAPRSSLRIQMELGPDTVRGFARVVRVQPPDPERPGEPSGVGVTFYGLGRDEERLLRKAISELRLRYQP